MTEIDIHADDYALTVHTSEDILDCIREGKLDSISIVPNMSCFKECMGLLSEAIPGLPFLPRMSIHLDFVEGSSLAGTGEVPLLTKGKDELLRVSWGDLFLLSYHPLKYKEARSQLKKEIKAQMEAGWKEIIHCMEAAREAGVPCRQQGMRLDSHQHAHMIPVVWKALTEVIGEEDYPIEYIRNSKEMLWPFLADVSLWKTYRPINFVKNRLLFLYSHKADRYAEKHNMEQMYMWGLVMSGRMDYDRIVRLYPAIKAKAEKENRVLEFCIHPGLSLPEEITEAIGENAADDFYLHSDRQIEKKAVMQLGSSEEFLQFRYFFR